MPNDTTANESHELIVYTVKDVARILRISEAKVRQLVHDDESGLRGSRVGDVEIRVTHDDLVGYLEANPVSGKAECRRGPEK